MTAPHVPVTSSTHALAVTMYVGMIILGVAHAPGVISSRAVQEVLALSLIHISEPTRR